MSTCVMCDQKARMVNNRWGHTVKYCSPECGQAYARSSKCCRAQLQQALEERRHLNDRIDELKMNLIEALGREAES